MSERELVELVAAAIADPGATTPRLPNEHVTEWTARAVLAGLEDGDNERVKCGEFLGYGWQEECVCLRSKGHTGLHACEYAEAKS